MSLIEETVLLMRDANNIKKEYEPVVELNTYSNEVQLSFYDGLEYNLKSFVHLADGKNITFEDRDDSDYPYEAYFEVDEVKFFILLLYGQKEELEDLITEKQTHNFIKGLEEL